MNTGFYLDPKHCQPVSEPTCSEFTCWKASVCNAKVQQKFDSQALLLLADAHHRVSRIDRELLASQLSKRTALEWTVLWTGDYVRDIAVSVKDLRWNSLWLAYSPEALAPMCFIVVQKTLRCIWLPEFIWRPLVRPKADNHERFQQLRDLVLRFDREEYASRQERRRRYHCTKFVDIAAYLRRAVRIVHSERKSKGSSTTTPVPADRKPTAKVPRRSKRPRTAPASATVLAVPHAVVTAPAPVDALLTATGPIPAATAAASDAQMPTMAAPLLTDINASHSSSMYDRFRRRFGSKRVRIG